MRNESNSKPKTEQRSRDAISPDVGKAKTFRDLSPENQERAQGRFFNAGPSDGYLYELDINGDLLCRRHIHF